MRVCELGGGPLERRVGRVVGVAGSRAGSGMLQWISLGSAGELGAHLAHPVAQADHPVEALAGEHAEVLRAPAGEVDAVLAHHPHRVGVQRLGMAAGAARLDRAAGRAARRAPRPSGSERCCRCTGTAPARRRTGGRRRAAARRERQARVQRPAGRATAARRSAPDRACSRLSRPSAELRRVDTSPPSRSWPRWYETRFCGSPTSAVSSRTSRSLRASSPSSRQRSGCPASCRKPRRREIGCRGRRGHRPDDTSIYFDRQRPGTGRRPADPGPPVRRGRTGRGS